jgi:glycosyltransferase involved in cell wall biosynthesis
VTPIAFVTAGPIEQITGGYLYDRRIVEGLRAQGRTVTLIPLAGRHPDPDAESLGAADRQLGRLGPDVVLVIDGLAAPACLATLRSRRDLRAILLAHHPLGLETGLEPALASRLQALECRVIGLARGAICPSPASAKAVVEMGMPAAKVHVIPPGLDPVSRPPVPKSTGPVRLLSVGTVIPRKGHALLVEALARLVDRDWHLTIIGSLDPDPATASALKQAIEHHGLGDRILLAGEHPPDTLAEAYRAADIFVLPSFHEGYGMVYAEAMAHGLPIIATNAGAIPETVPGTAGLLVPPGDIEALMEALGRLIRDSALRRDLGRAGAAYARGLPDWPIRARDFGRGIDMILKIG